MYLKSRKCIGFCLIKLVSTVKMCCCIFRPFTHSELPRAVRFTFIWAGPGYGKPTVRRVFVDFLSVPTAKFRDINHNFGPNPPPFYNLPFYVYTILYNVVT